MADGPLLTLCLGSLAVVIAGGLVQVSHGAYSMTAADAWRAVFNPNVVFNLQAAVDRAIDLAGVEHLRDSAMSTLSGGQKQLAWIAMVLAQETDVLLLDEPTTFLDLHHQLRVLSVVRTLNREAGVTVGIVLHDIWQAARFADNLMAMQDGSLYDWGPPTDVVTEQLLADVFRADASVDSESPTGPHIAPHSAIEE